MSAAWPVPAACAGRARRATRAVLATRARPVAFARTVLAILLLLVGLAATAPASAQAASRPAPLEFRDAAEERRFHALVAELRCVMCQNQSLADSNAQIAVDLRREVLELMREGRSDAQVKDFLVERYGEFVLYRPQVRPRHWLLWFGPGLVLLAGAAIVVTVVRRRAAAVPTATPPDETEEW